jgi:hypothetical protein
MKTFDDKTANISSYNQQRAVHLFVMQQLYFQYVQTLRDFRKYLTQETQNFNKDVANNEKTPVSVSFIYCVGIDVVSWFYYCSIIIVALLLWHYYCGIIIVALLLYLNSVHL